MGLVRGVGAKRDVEWVADAAMSEVQGRTFAEELRVSPPTRTVYDSAADFFTAVNERAAVCYNEAALPSSSSALFPAVPSSTLVVTSSEGSSFSLWFMRVRILVTFLTSSSRLLDAGSLVLEGASMVPVVCNC